VNKLSIVIILILFFLTGCTYTGYTHKGFHESNNLITDKINLSAALVNTQELQNFRIQESSGGYTFTFIINPAFNEELVKELRNVFSDVQIIATQREIDKFNIQVIPTFAYKYIDGNYWNGQFRYKFTTILTIRDLELNTTIDSFKDTQDVILSRSAGATVVGVITGLSLFILSPITIPLITQINGDKAMNTIEESLSRSIKSLSYQIANNPKIYNYRLNRK
jgi:hypothetical protein